MIGQGISPFFHRGPSGPPLPTEVFGSDLIAWWNSERSTLDMDGDGGIALWEDLSGNGRHFEPIEGVAPPGLLQNGLNGKRVADLNGSEAMQNVTPAEDWRFLHDGTPYTVLSVFKPGNVADPDSLYVLMSTGAGGGGTPFFQCFFDDRSANGADNSFGQFIRNSNSGTVLDNRSANGYTPANSWHHGEVQADPSNSTAADRSIITADDQSEQKNNTETASPTSGNSDHTLRLGESKGMFYFTGQFAESLIILGHATQSQLDWWENAWTPNEWAL